MKHKLKYLVFALLAILAAHTLTGGKREGYFYSRSVKLLGGGHQCSGEQVRGPSGVSYILTAAHCAKLADAQGNIEVIKEDGDKISRKIITEDPSSDLLLLEGLPGVAGLDIATSLKPHERVRTYTHGHGMDTYRTDGMIIQNIRIQAGVSEITTDQEELACNNLPKYKVVELDNTPFGPLKACILDVEETLTTAMIQPGSSGGMVVNESGELVGVVSVGDGAYGGLVELKDIKNFLKVF